MATGPDGVGDFDSGAWVDTDAAPPPLRVTGLSIGLGAWAAAAFVLASLPTAPDAALPSDVFLLSRALAAADVSVRDGSSTRPCKWHPGDRRFVCGDSPWAFVGAFGGYANGQPLKCVWAHPQPGGGNIIFTLRNQQFGSRVEARLALLNDVGAGAEVKLRVLADGVEVGAAATAEGRTVASFDQPIAAGAGRGEFTVEVSAREHFWRHACVEVLMTGRRADPAAAGAGPHG
ncbi:MAG: hypothetical protein EXR79_03445 [Myxococcales bacterium]|nr:hypothetical protein [Myxococcales bacterium]